MAIYTFRRAMDRRGVLQKVRIISVSGAEVFNLNREELVELLRVLSPDLIFVNGAAQLAEAGDVPPVHDRR